MFRQDKPDFIETGQGPKVILFHSSASGARQWRSLMDTLADRYHLIAINLFGYGKTAPWNKDRPQTLEDQAELIAPFLAKGDERVSIVGHSFGGSVAMKAAALFKKQVGSLVLIEPIPFYLLKKHARSEAYQEALDLREAVRVNGRAGSWDAAAKVFANYWTGAGSWEAMTDDRKSRFSESLQPNFHEWDAVMNETTSLSDWRDSLPNETTVISAADTVRSIREICGLMKENVPSWTYEKIERGGHMAVLTKSALINPLVEKALA
ncbi:Dihydrolipoyllysine-residue acetyltransferase component of acetoin cleaving system [Thalassovita gelatinovora]|uniref:Dihydrolipoyllysine-residue acetyltransferase component of acetoin cleaving system n=1 Tax=Thalassovita gelatinovora TaxID=53501 RepID=A0A0P1F9H6_THAGE|nr:alpha/beta hydrolase [Thalassovita gelatinovora]QIZ81218.1 alpha/beta hydrolase [Thalassovita gelatinovora]CUH64689.1 Dihydrolipoyllysine-residue acetyltransferase component of acetoin cleaving system [Thalassovita gelatinovora]SEP93667.1 Pimeloyl-ACP methyl ester carboxylesterase [Thalassovita gelatinovora]